MEPGNYIHLKSQDSNLNHSSGTRVKAEKKFGLGKEKVILCSNCGNPVTTSEHIISVDGEHIHNFTNPAGLTFEIGCFSDAQGCLTFGEPTIEHTWFRDFYWSISSCSSCRIHLGWYYENEYAFFYGLITELLLNSSH